MKEFTKAREQMAEWGRQGDPSRFCEYLSESVYRPQWMSNDQWSQIVDWYFGEAIPTDEELVQGLSAAISYAHRNRCTKYLYSSIPSYLVGAENYVEWSGLIERNRDLEMDRGL